MAGRLYVVENEESMTIVRALSNASALSHVVKEQYKVRTATADDVETYMSAGGEVEDATIKVGNTSIPEPGLNDNSEGGEEE